MAVLKSDPFFSFANELSDDDKVNYPDFNIEPLGCCCLPYQLSNSCECLSLTRNESIEKDPYGILFDDDTLLGDLVTMSPESEVSEASEASEASALHVVTKVTEAPKVTTASEVSEVSIVTILQQNITLLNSIRIINNIPSKVKKITRTRVKPTIDGYFGSSQLKTAIIGLIKLLRNRLPCSECPPYITPKNWSHLLDAVDNNALIHVVSFDRIMKLDMYDDYDCLVHANTLYGSALTSRIDIKTRFRWWTQIKLFDEIRCNNERNTTHNIPPRLHRIIKLPTQITSNRYLQHLFNNNLHLELLNQLCIFFQSLLRRIYSSRDVKQFIDSPQMYVRRQFKYICDPRQALQETLKEFTTKWNKML